MDTDQNWNKSRVTVGVIDATMLEVSSFPIYFVVVGQIPFDPFCSIGVLSASMSGFGPFLASVVGHSIKDAIRLGTKGF